jgi:DNA-binding MarR family transcriptional regulator
VVRIPDPSDGRSAIVSISPDGRALLRRLRQRKTAYLAKRLRELPDQDMQALARAAEVLEGILEERP